MIKQHKTFKNLINEEYDNEVEIGDIEYWKQNNSSVYDSIIDNMRETMLDYDWWENVYENFRHDMMSKYKWAPSHNEIMFSGFYSQGDGASFEGELSSGDVLDLLGVIYKKFPLSECIEKGHIDVDVTFNRHGRYSHEKSVTTNVEIGCNDYEGIFEVCKKELQKGELKGVKTYSEDYDNDIEEYVIGFTEELEDTIDSWRIDACKKLYKELEEEYSYLTSDEQIYELCLSNGYEFDSSGSLQ